MFLALSLILEITITIANLSSSFFFFFGGGGGGGGGDLNFSLSSLYFVLFSLFYENNDVITQMY